MIRTIFVLLAMAAGGTAAQARHMTHDLDLVNRSRATVASFFASNTGADHWDVDLLAGTGYSRTTSCSSTWMISPASATTTSRWSSPTERTVIRRNVNVCERRIYTLTD